MSATAPGQTESAHPPDIILNERSCIGCGYSLKGLRLGGNCPECGLAIKGRKRAPRYTDQLVHAPMEWLEVFATGALLMFLAATAALVMFLTLLFVRNVQVLVVLGGITLGWVVGVWLCSRPRPVMPTTTVNVLREWRGLRIAARVTQCFWPLSVLLILFAIWVYNTTVSTAALYAAISVAGVSLVVAVGGLGPTCAFLAHLADWAEDSSLAQSLRGCAWTIGFCGLVISLAVLNAYTGLLGRAMGGVLAVCLIGMVFLPPGYFLFCLFRMQSMARWAVWNHVAAEAKLDRFRARAEAAARRPAQGSSPRHTPPPAR
jgi:hypothetical protein